jgi:HEPN domain-containing protein
MRPLTREWVDKAEEDHQAAEALGAGPDSVWGPICFLSQQCAGKYLKAWLVEQGVDFRKTHDLDHVGKLCAPSLGEIEALMDDLRFLTSFAVEVRYPGMSPTREDANRCREVSGAVRDAVRSALNRICRYCIDGSEAQ